MSNLAFAKPKVSSNAVRVQRTLNALEKAGSDSVILADCCLSLKDAEFLAQHISKNKNLTSIDLRGNQLRGEAVVVIANAISETDTLRTLSMEWNSCGVFPDGMRALANSIAHHKSLNNLDLRNNRIGSDGAVSLATALRTNKSLLRLDLRWNGMGTSGSRALAAALDENHTLLNLEISGNGATEESVSKIQNALRRNKMRDSEPFGAGPAISESSNDQNVASLENQINDANEEKSTKISKDTKQRLYNQTLSQERKDIEMAIPQSLEGAILCIRTLEDRLRVARSEVRDIGSKYDTEVRAHTRCKNHLEEMMSSLESEKIQHKETIENYESHIEEFNRKIKAVEDNLRKEKEINVNHELESKKVTVELREAARHAESKLSDANAEIDRNEKIRESLEQQLKDLHAKLRQKQSLLLEAEEKVEKAVKDARREERDAMRIQLNIAEEGRAHAEDRRKKMAEMHDDLNKQLREAKTTYMNERIEHQKALEATEMRIRSELEKSSKTSLQQLEAQLKALEVSHDRLQKKIAKTQIVLLMVKNGQPSN